MDIGTLKGIGPKTEKILKNNGIMTTKDLNSYYFQNDTEYKIKFNNDNFVYITSYSTGFKDFDVVKHLRNKLCEYKQKSEELEMRLKKYE